MSTARQTTVRRGAVLVGAAVASALISTAALATPVPLQNATATFSQSGFPITAAVDGNPGGAGVLNGWALDPNEVTQTAVFETTTDLVSAGGTAFTFVLTQNFGTQHTIGKFRLSVTDSPRGDFADSLQPGDVTANWTQLTPLTAVSGAGATLTIQGDNSILASGTNPAQDVYTITASTLVNNITGIRLEVIEDPSLPGNGPGRQPSNGNIVLQEFQVDAVAIPEPATASLLAVAAFAGLRRRPRHTR